MIRLTQIITVFLLFAGLVGCAGGGPHLSIEPQVGPTPGPAGLPPITGNIQAIGVGGGLAQSESFIVYGSLSSTGGRTAGGANQWVSLDLDIGDLLMGGTE